MEIDEDLDWENDDALDKALNLMPTQDTQATIANVEVSSGDEEEKKQAATGKKQKAKPAQKAKKEEQPVEITGNALDGILTG